MPDESGQLQAHWIQSDNPRTLTVSSSLNIACNLLERDNLDLEPPFVAEKHRTRRVGIYISRENKSSKASGSYDTNPSPYATPSTLSAGTSNSKLGCFSHRFLE